MRISISPSTFSGFSGIGNNLSLTLTSKQKKICVIAIAVFALLAAAYYFIRTLCKEKIVPADPVEDEKILEVMQVAEQKMNEAEPPPVEVPPQEIPLLENAQTEPVSPSFTERMDLFFADLQRDDAEPEKRFEELFPEKISEEQARLFAERAKIEIQTAYFADLFANAISTPLLKMMRKLIHDEPLSFSEELRAALTLSYCIEKNLSVSEVVIEMQDAEIKTEYLHYQFADHLAEQKGAELCAEIDSFNLDSEDLREIADRVLYSDADAFFSNLDEFGYREDEVRKEYYLRGLIRSVDAANKILDDFSFIERLRALSPEVLKTIYQNFKFGQSVIEGCKDEAKDKKGEDEVFALLMQKTLPELTVLGFKKASFFFDRLPEKKRLQLLAMILLLLNFEKPEVIVLESEMLNFLKELKTLKDPNARFAAVAMILKFKREGLNYKQFFSAKGQANENPMHCSLVLFACKHLCPDVACFGKKKLNNPEFVKSVIIFLAELYYAEELGDESKAAILKRILENKKLQTTNKLLQFTSCIRRRLTQPLRMGDDPEKILAENLKSSLDSLGEPYNCKLSKELLGQLKFPEELGYYAQGLERLPQEEKDRMIPFFFNFLTLTAEGKLVESRYETKEIGSIFKSYSLDLWKKRERRTAAELLKDDPEFDMMEDEPLNFQNELQIAFENEHLKQEEYPDFYRAAFGESRGQFLKLDGPEIGQLKKKGDDIESKKKLVSHALGKLFQEKEINMQLKYLKEIHKLIESDKGDKADFLNDIDHWITWVNDRLAKKRETMEITILSEAMIHIFFSVRG